jgi:hypothetical protein
MIFETVDFLAKEIEKYIHQITINTPTPVSIKIGQVASAADSNAHNSFGQLTLVNIGEEELLTHQTSISLDNNNVVTPNLNLYVLLSFHLPAYGDALKCLGCSISFFQHQPIFNRETNPNIPDTLQQIIVEHYSLNLEEQHHLWSTIGVPYKPSVLYRVRVKAISNLS